MSEYNLGQHVVKISEKSLFPGCKTLMTSDETHVVPIFLVLFAGFPRVRNIKNETHNKGKQSGQISTSD